jgi:hypothetical protein
MACFRLHNYLIDTRGDEENDDDQYQFEIDGDMDENEGPPIDNAQNNRFFSQFNSFVAANNL